jgi:hypothetical protein
MDKVLSGGNGADMDDCTTTVLYCGHSDGVRWFRHLQRIAYMADLFSERINSHACLLKARNEFMHILQW